MGTVYLAVRADDEYRQQVAIKLVHQTASDEQRSRLRDERQILADLEHPNIARLVDGGTTESGLPYLVMEYVEGTPIDEYCEGQALSATQRIALVRRVCTAVQYAHRNLVVHRDIKPENILITSDGTPKLLDFGIAKLLEPGADGPEVTLPGQRALTPSYASPEQLRGRSITTAADVYSLGVLLYRLLTGRPPRVFLSLAPAEIERVLAREPTRPGLGRDLDRILLKTLDEEPERRYASVDRLSEDLRRYIVGLPVLARPHTFTYRVGKFVRRHQVGVTVGAAGLTLVFGFLIDKARQADVIASERDRASIESAKARDVASFLVELLQDSDPWRTPGREVTVREVLDRGSEEIRRRLGDEPELRGMLLDTMGSIYLNLGRYDMAEPLLEEGLAERLRVLPDDHPDVAASLGNLGNLLQAKGEYEEAERTLRRALAIRRQAAEPDELAVADSLFDLALLLFLEGEYEETESLHRQALELRRASLGDDHPKVAASRKRLASLYTEIGRFEDAEKLFQSALDSERRHLGPGHPGVAVTLNHLASLLRRRGELDTAEAMFREVLEIRQPIFGDQHLQVGQARNNLAAVLLEKGEIEEAEELYRQALDLAVRLLGEDHRDVAVGYTSLGKLLHLKGDLVASEEHLRRGLEIVRRVLPPGHPGASYPLRHLAELKLDAGEPEKAEPLLREASELRVRALPAGHPGIVEIQSLLGGCLVRLGRFDEAEKLLLECHASVAGGPRVAGVLEGLVALYESWGRSDQAESYRRQLERLES